MKQNPSQNREKYKEKKKQNVFDGVGEGKRKKRRGEDTRNGGAVYVVEQRVT